MKVKKFKPIPKKKPNKVKVVKTRIIKDDNGKFVVQDVTPSESEVESIDLKSDSSKLR